MAEEYYNRNSGEQAGVIRKAASLAAQEVTEDELKEINNFTLAPLTAEEVFTFKAVLCDNAVDRTYERFTAKALADLQKLFVGKTIIKDHWRSADNQVARIYRTELQVDQTTQASAGEDYTQLVAYCYMVRTASNADLITEIKAGIKKEGSVGCSITGAICSICGTDNTKSYCKHWPGRSYDKEEGKVLCTFTLTGASDAYEFSLVAVPAQRAAGVSKSYMGTECPEEVTPEPTEEKKKEEENDEAIKTAARLRLNKARAAFLINKN